jgi:hypothetical protein
VLEILNILGCMEEMRLRIVSDSLRCVQISMSSIELIEVVKAPLLERLVMYRSSPNAARGLCTKFRIADAPRLRALGYMEPGQVLEIRDTVIMVWYIPPSQLFPLVRLAIMSN